MFYDENNILTSPAERVQFDLQQNSRPSAVFSTRIAHVCEIVMIFREPLLLGHTGFADALFLSDPNGFFIAWV